MEILGIGAPELIFIVIIALIVLGPKDMQKAGKTIGKWLRDTVTSDSWKLFQQTTRELRNLPNRLMREANEDLNKIGDELNTASQPDGKPPIILRSACRRQNLSHHQPRQHPNDLSKTIQ